MIQGTIPTAESGQQFGARNVKYVQEASSIMNYHLKCCRRAPPLV